MFDSIYIGMSGLTSFSKGLTNISNNVANLNTTGFKGTELQFLDLYYQNSYSGSNGDRNTLLSQGSGVKAGATTTRFVQGDFRQTGNDLDVAIDGNGFFVLEQNGQLSYTRSGQFAIDGSGNLVANDGVSRVKGFVNGGLADLNISGFRSVPAKATSEIKFSNTLSVNSPTYQLSNVTAIDSLGQQHALTLNFTNDTANNPGQWTVQVLDGTTAVGSGTIDYSGSGSPIPGSDSFSFLYTPTTGTTPTQITLNFSATTSLSASSSSVQVSTQNGVAAGFLSKTTIDTDGNLVLSYSNGDTKKIGQVALTNFSNLASLVAQGGNRFTVFGHTAQITGTPGKLSLGKLKTGGIELSNVDLAKEFSELIIVQRGYQASSQVISTANDMMQQLADIKGRK